MGDGPEGTLLLQMLDENREFGAPFGEIESSFQVCLWGRMRGADRASSCAGTSGDSTVEEPEVV
jgi:hypothetical protein